MVIHGTAIGLDTTPITQRRTQHRHEHEPLPFTALAVVLTAIALDRDLTRVQTEARPKRHVPAVAANAQEPGKLSAPMGTLPQGHEHAVEGRAT